MSKTKISIIIPVYNIENYIGKCIDSAVNQTFDDFEIIVVDDGSRDRSGSICDEYAQKYDKVKVYHKENGGLSHARNYGMKRADGEYVLFVDGDDMITPEACEVLYKEAKAENAEVVVGCAVLTKASKAMERFEQIAAENFEMHKLYTGKEYLEKSLKGGALRVDVWRCLYSNEFLANNNLDFEVGLTHEDEMFTPKMFLCAERVVVCDYKFYIYNNDRLDSIVNSVNPKKAYDRIKICNMLLDLYKNVKPRKLRKLLKDDVSWKYIDCCSVYKMYDFDDFTPDRFLPLRTAHTLKRKIKAILFAVNPKIFSK